MNQALKRFGFLLQLCLLCFGLTAHALALNSDTFTPEALFERLTGDTRVTPDPFASRPDTINPSAFSLEKTRVAETGPFEKEEEEEVRYTGGSFKVPPFTGSGSSAFMGSLALVPPGPISDGPLHLLRPHAGSTSTRKHIQLQVFRI